MEGLVGQWCGHTGTVITLAAHAVYRAKVHDYSSGLVVVYEFIEGLSTCQSGLKKNSRVLTRF